MASDRRDRGRPTLGDGGESSRADGGTAAPADESRDPAGGSTGTPLEPQPSAVRFVLFAADGRSAAGSQAAGPPSDPAAGFAFPGSPIVAGTDRSGAFFDTTAATTTGSGDTIHYALRFGGRRTPYVLRHEGGGTYTSREAVTSFEWTGDERFPLPGLTVGRAYQAIVREVVQLYEPGGPFDWAVSRADFIDRRTDVRHVSILYVVWDLDGPTNDAADDRGAVGIPASEPAGPVPPHFPADATPTIDGRRIAETARVLIGASEMT